MHPIEFQFKSHFLMFADLPRCLLCKPNTVESGQTFLCVVLQKHEENVYCCILSLVLYHSITSLTLVNRRVIHD